MNSLPLFIVSLLLLFFGQGENPGKRLVNVLPFPKEQSPLLRNMLPESDDLSQPHLNSAITHSSSVPTRVERVSQYWLNPQWMNSSREIITYTASGAETEKISSYWNDTTSVWIPDSRSTSVYNSLGLLQCVLIERANDSGWIISSRDSFSYDENRNCIKKQKQNLYSNGWINRERVEYIYDSNNNLIDENQTYWNGLTWTKRYKIAWIYDKDNLMLERTLQKVRNQEWNFASKYQYEYGSNREASRTFYFTWISGKNEWRLRSKSEYSYDGKGNMQHSQGYSISDSGWVLTSETFNEYDKYKRMLKSTWSDLTDSSGGYFVIKANRYDAAGRLLEYSYCTYIDSQMSSGQRFFYAYTPLDVTTETGATETDFQLFANYPNPFNSGTIFNYRLNAGGIVSLKVYTILGEEVAVLKDGYESAGIKAASWNAEDLPSGIYIVRLVEGQHTQSRKILLLK